MAKGIIYIMTTSVIGLIKIGKTTKFESRMTQLEQNGYWNVSGLRRYYAVEVDDYDEKERLIHTVFSKSQVSNSELFALDVELAKDMLDAFEGTVIYPKQDTKPTPKTVSLKQDKPSKAEKLTFGMLGIPVGTTLTFTEDKRITCVTQDTDNKVVYNGKIYSISGLVKMLKNRGKNTDTPYQGGLFLEYKGEKLTDMRKRLGK